MAKIQLPSVALAKEIKENPYARFMTKSLADRCFEIQQQEGAGHWASLRAELVLAKATLADVVRMWAAMHELPPDFKERQSRILEAGAMLRDAIKEIGDLAAKAAQIETTLRDKHDPTITMQFIQQTVKVMDNALRQAEEEGKIVDAEALITSITNGVEEGVRLPMHSPNALNDDNRRACGVTPAAVADTVKAMIETVPAA